MGVSYNPESTPYSFWLPRVGPSVNVAGINIDRQGDKNKKTLAGLVKGFLVLPNPIPEGLIDCLLVRLTCKGVNIAGVN